MPAISRYWQLLGAVVALQLGCVRAGFDLDSNPDSDVGRPSADLALAPADTRPADGGPGEAPDMAPVGGELAAWLTLEGQRNGYLQLPARC